MGFEKGEIKAVIFDIGGVLVENPDYGDFWKGIEESKKLREDFGTGKINSSEFLKRGSKLFNLSKKEFLEEYKRYYWKGELIVPVFNLFKSIELKRYILSDTNPIHKQYLKKKFPEIFRLADRVFLNLRKYNPDSFMLVLKKIKLSNKEVIFIDDRRELIEVANSLGINSILLDNPENLKNKLIELGVKV